MSHNRKYLQFHLPEQDESSFVSAFHYMFSVRKTFSSYQRRRHTLVGFIINQVVCLSTRTHNHSTSSSYQAPLERETNPDSVAARQGSFSDTRKEAGLAATLLPPERYQYDAVPGFFSGAPRGSTSGQPASLSPGDLLTPGLHASVSATWILYCNEDQTPLCIGICL